MWNEAVWRLGEAENKVQKCQQDYCDLLYNIYNRPNSLPV